MATLGRMRNHGVFLIVVVGIAILAFIVGDLINSSSSIINESRSNIAKVNGKKINAQEYEAAINQLTEVYKIEWGTQSLPDETVEQIRQQVWEQMVRERVLTADAEDAGLVVGESELADLLFGNNISPLISGRRAFQNPKTNAFDPAVVMQFISMLDSEDAAQMPAEQLRTYREYWKFWESQVKYTRLEQKYNSLLSSLFVANTLDAEDAFEGSRTSVDVVYAIKPYFSVADSLITVSDKEAKALYKERKKQYEQEAACDLLYAEFEVKPSAEDFAEVEEWINALKDEFTTTDDVAGVTNSNSDNAYKGVNLAKSDIAEELQEFAFSGKKGDVFGPALAGDTYKMARIVENGINLPDSVKLRHIYISKSTMEATQLLADSLESVLRAGGDFAALARQFSVAQTAGNGGEIGWVRENEVDRDLAEKAFATAANGIFQLKNYNGVQIFQVEERGASVAKVKLAILERKVVASSQTQAQIYNAAKQFAASCTSVEDFEAKAQEQNIAVQSARNLNTASARVNNIKNSRQVVRWAFNEAKDGEVSDVFECDNKHLVVAVNRLVEKGYTDFEDVKMQLIAEVRNDKKAEQLEAEFAQKSIEDLRAEGATVDTVRGVNFNMPYAGSLGSEPTLFALAPRAEKDVLSAPQKGNMGVYVFQVVDKNVSEAEFDAKEEKMMLTERAKYVVQYLSFEALKEEANIVDERYKFF